MTNAYPLGLRVNAGQFSQQLLQVLLVGLTLGLMRTVVPALAETEFGVPRTSFLLLVSFIVAFGVVKGILNFVAGALSDRIGRRAVLIWGWLSAIPIPFMVAYADHWYWIVAATALLGVNQGLTWSMTQTAKLDLTHAHERGTAIGLNEFAGYVGVAVAGIVTAYLAERLGARTALFVFGATVIASALLLSIVAIRDTLPWATAQAKRVGHSSVGDLSVRAVFMQVSWRNRQLAALTQAGLVEKFVDALVWVFYPIFLYQRGLSLGDIGWIVGIYGFTWGIAQLFTGRLSDRVGRRRPIVFGMWLCALGVALMLVVDTHSGWGLSAFVTGMGMALLYPTLSAAVADLAHPKWRGMAIGVYRFWRDLGYAIGALALGVVGLFTNQLAAGFIFVAVAMLASGLWVWLALAPAAPQRR